MKKLHLLRTMLLLVAVLVGSSSAWAETKPWSCDDPTSTLDLKTITSNNMGTWKDAKSWYLDDNYLIVSGYASYQSVSNQKWITYTGTGSSNSNVTTNWVASDPFKGNTYYTTGNYATLQSGRAIVYKVTNLKSLKVYGKNNSTSKYLDIFIYTKSGDDYTKVEEIKYTTDNNVHIWNNNTTLSPSNTYFVYITGAGGSNSQLYEVAFERAVPAPTAIAFKTGDTTYTNGGETKNDLGSGASVNVTIEPDQTADVYYTLDGTTPTKSSTKYTNAIAITEPCTLTALATNSAGNTTASVAFKFSRANGLAFGSSEYTAYLANGTFSTTLTNPNNLDVTYSSTDENVATVAADGTVTLKDGGETTIKATFAGNDTYAAGVAQYTLTVSNKTSAGLEYDPTFIHIEEPTYNTEISAPVALTNPHSVAVAYSSSDATVAAVNATTGAVTPKKLGTTTITATFDGDATYEAAAVSYTLKLGLQDAGLIFGEDDPSVTYTSEGTYTNGFVKDTDAAATFTSSNTNVATVNATSGEVTVLSVGTTTITATTAKTSDYKAGNASYTLTVTENNSAPTISATTTILNETFDTNNQTGGNDGTWSGISTTPTPSFDLTGWTYSSAYAGNKCVRTGKSGNITSPALGVEGDVTLTFKMAAWGNDTNNGYVDILNGGTFEDGTSTQKQITIKKSEWDSFELTLQDVTEDTKIKFSDNGNSKRLFIDEVKVTQSTTPTVSVTVPASTWGTYCSPYKLDLSNDATTVNAYVVSSYDINNKKITFTKATGVVPAKTPLVIQGTAGAQKIAVSTGDDTPTGTNKLIGYLSPTYYDNTADASHAIMGLSSGTFYLLDSGTIPANKAVLQISSSEANDLENNDSRFTFVIEDETETDGISSHNVNFVKFDGNAYNLAGQRVGNDYKGIVIVNGKKVIRK
ncbi:MAG: chitobiase/beta-hexosaminidase C-terminal domain-containing protein [Prevotella sp.]|nr:chitobiase/beta-hexosaminidase C-terminal domain-containing protein [Prevotella sp.]